MKSMRSRVDIRVTAEEKKQLQELARDTGETVSEYIRRKLFGRKVTVRYLDQDKGKKGLV